MYKCFKLILVLVVWVNFVWAEDLSREEWLKKDEILDSKGSFAYKKGKYETSLDYYQESLKIRENILGKEHPKTATSYGSLGASYYAMGEYAKALIYQKKSLKIRENILGEKHTTTAKSYNNIALLYGAMRDYDKALSYFQKSMDINEKSLGKEHYVTGISYYNIGGLYRKKGNYHKALSYYQGNLEIVNKVYGKEHPETAISYRNLGELYYLMGNYKKANDNYQESLGIREAIFGKEHPDTALIYSDIGMTYQQMGDYPKALTYAEKSLAIREKNLGKDHSDTAISYNSIGELYYLLGNYIQAQGYFQKSLDIRENIFGKEQLITATSYNNFGMLFQKLNNYSKALSYTQKSLAIREKFLGKEHPETAKSYNNIGLHYEALGNHTKALDYHLKSLAIIEKTLGFGHSNLAGSYLNIGLLYKKKKNYPKALSYYQKSLSLWEKILGKEHPNTAITYNSIGSLYLSMADYPKAYLYAKKSFNNFLNNRDKNFVVLDNKQKKQYLKQNSHKVSLLLSTAYLHAGSNAKQIDILSQDTLNSWLNYKGSIFDSENAIALLHESTKDKKLKSKINSLVSLKHDLAKIYQSLPGNKKGMITWKEKIKNTEKKIAKLTIEIASKASNFKQEQGIKVINYKDIASHLKSNELYIDYAKAGNHYYVFSLDHKENISFTQIDENRTRKIDNLVKEFREDIAVILSDNKITRLKLKVLIQSSENKLLSLYILTITQPFGKLLNTKKTLIISPDGALRLLPFEALYNGANGKYLIEEKEIRYIPSGKELVRLYKYSKDKATQRTSVIFSNPNFNTKIASVSKEKIAITPNTTRSGIIKSLFRMRFAPLPGTRVEAKAIKATLEKDTLLEFQQEQATESNLMKVKEPRILHIATHGFFINDKSIPNPMLKSGLALAGANNSAIRGKSDGIVTALKLSGLDLKGTDLVVLSACQTGVVDINETESVSGLSKAFIQAGAKNIVMSLWSVDDQATKDLMTSFYQEMKASTSYAKSLKAAKLKMITEGRHPFYWAAFVLSGL